MMKYTIHRTETSPLSPFYASNSEKLKERWNNHLWQKANILHIDKFHPQSSSHRPKTEAKLLYDEKNLYVMFRVEDQYIKAMYTQYQDPVCNDSCVEFFVMPSPSPPIIMEEGGYFNFEINCCGTMLLYYIEDPRRTTDGFEKYEPIKQELAGRMTILHSIPGKVDVEIESPVEWYLEYNIPFSLFEAYLGSLNRGQGVVWSGNFYKCGDQTSHPHWASWVSIDKDLNFHQPDSFGILEFGL
jgi:hypothetical protein